MKWLVLCAVVLVGACASEDSAETAGSAAAADPAEAAGTAGEEWTPLFDGETLAGWRGLQTGAIPAGHWVVEDGMIRKVASAQVPRADDGQVLEGGDIMTEATYRDYEFAFEWRVSEGGNSGIKYNVDRTLSVETPPPTGALGFEYQILDDDRHMDREVASHRAASLYDLIAAPDDKPLRTVGTFNESRIIWRGGVGEHWLNGERVVRFEVATAAFDSAFAASKYAEIPAMAEPRDGHIVLQDHGDDVWFRNLRIRTFDSRP